MTPRQSGIKLSPAELWSISIISTFHHSYRKIHMRYCILAFVAGLIACSCVGCSCTKQYRIEISHKDVHVSLDTREF